MTARLLKKTSCFLVILICTFSFNAFAAEVVLSLQVYEQEYDSWCWAACSKMVIAYLTYGYNPPPSQFGIANWALPGTPDGSDDETNFAYYESGGKYGVTQILNHFGTYCFIAGYVDHSDLQAPNYPSFLDIWNTLIYYHPIIANWDWDDQTSPWEGHFVVLTGADDSSNEVRFADPFFGDSWWVDYSWFKEGSHSNCELYPCGGDDGIPNYHYWIESVGTYCYWAYCPWAWENWYWN